MRTLAGAARDLAPSHLGQAQGQADGEGSHGDPRRFWRGGPGVEAPGAPMHRAVAGFPGSPRDSRRHFGSAATAER